MVNSFRGSAVIIASALLMLALTANGFCQQPRMDKYQDPLPAGAIARLGTVRLRHSDRITKVAFAPQGNVVASSTSSGTTVRLWNVDNGKLAVELKVNENWRYFGGPFAFSPNGKTVYALLHGDVVAYNAADGKLNGTTISRGSGESFRELSLSAQGDVLALVSGPVLGRKLVRLVDVASKKDLSAVDRTGQPDINIQKTVFSPSGELLVCFSDDALEVWDLKRKTVVWDFRKENVSFSGVSFSPDGSKLAVCSEDSISILASVNGKVESTLQHDFIDSPAAVFCNNGLLAFAGGEAKIILHDLRTKKNVGEIQAHETIQCLAVSPDGKTLAAGSNDHSLSLWDIASKKSRLSFPASGPVNFLAFTPWDNTLLVHRSAGIFEEWNVPDCTQTGKISAESLAPYNVSFLNQSRTMLFSGDRCACRIDGKKQATLFPEEDQYNHGSVAYAHDGVRIAVCPLKEGEIQIRDSKEKKRLATIKPTGPLRDCRSISSVCFSPDDSLLAAFVWSKDDKRTIVAWDTKTWKEVKKVTEERGVLYDRIAFTPDSKHIIADNANFCLEVWEVRTGVRHVLVQMPRGDAPVTCFTVCPVGDRIAVGSFRGAALLFDTKNGKVLRRWPGHDGPVSALAFSADGSLLATGGEDTTVLVWEVEGK